jgi:hypothetical protein
MPEFEPAFEYQSIRDESHAEHMLIANRLTWYVTSQSFLVTAFAISRGNGFGWFRWFSTLLIPAIGLLSSSLVFPSIVGACETIRLWHEKQCHFFLRHPEFKAAFWLERPPWIESRGLLFPKVIPVIFGVFWLVIHIASYFL